MVRFHARREDPYRRDDSDLYRKVERNGRAFNDRFTYPEGKPCLFSLVFKYVSIMLQSSFGVGIYCLILFFIIIILKSNYV